jgi:hypothetical protein
MSPGLGSFQLAGTRSTGSDLLGGALVNLLSPRSLGLPNAALATDTGGTPALVSEGRLDAGVTQAALTGGPSARELISALDAVFLDQVPSADVPF